jgi:hypothetical protein
MSVATGGLKELIGEHGTIVTYAQSLTKSAEALAARPLHVKQRILNYRRSLNEFKEAILSHLEIDERILKSVLGSGCPSDPLEEHLEIQQLINEMIEISEDAVVEKLEYADLTRYCARLGQAFEKICRLIELHRAKEDAVLQKVQKALNIQ